MTEIDFIQPKKLVGKLISVDVLDKIRAEVKDASLGEWYVGRTDGKDEEVVLLKEALEIIDKYRDKIKMQ